jgi:hypothetical protein
VVTLALDHYVPQFLLRKFIDQTDGRNVWVYTKDGTARRQKQTRNIARESNYYDIVGDDGSRDRVVEETFNGPLESDAAPALARLLSQDPPDALDKERICKFIAIQLIRTPRFRRLFGESIARAAMTGPQTIAASPVLFERSVKEQMAAGQLDLQGQSIEEFRQEVLQSFEHDVWTVNEETTLAAYDHLNPLVTVLFNMTWTTLEATGKRRFVTSDHPVVACAPERQVWWKFGTRLLQTSDMEITFPISPSIVLLGQWHQTPNTHVIICESDVAQINKRTIGWAEKYVFAAESSEEVSRLVIAHSDDSRLPNLRALR